MYHYASAQADQRLEFLYCLRECIHLVCNITVAKQSYERGRMQIKDLLEAQPGHILSERNGRELK